MNVNKLLKLMEYKEKEILVKMGGVGELAKSLGSDIQFGLTATTEQDLHHRRERYGVNVWERSPPRIWDLFFEEQDKNLLILLMAAGMNGHACTCI